MCAVKVSKKNDVDADVDVAISALFVVAVIVAVVVGQRSCFEITKQMLIVTSANEMGDKWGSVPLWERARCRKRHTSPERRWHQQRQQQQQRHSWGSI